MHNILILDDEIPSAKFTAQLLRKTFHESIKVFTKQSVADAFELINNNAVDLVLLDLQLNGESGFDLLDKVAIRNFDVICLSASDDHAIKAFEYYANGYLLKPVNMNELSKAINVWLSRKSKLTIQGNDSIKQ